MQPTKLVAEEMEKRTKEILMQIRQKIIPVTSYRGSEIDINETCINENRRQRAAGVVTGQ